MESDNLLEKELEELLSSSSAFTLKDSMITEASTDIVVKKDEDTSIEDKSNEDESSPRDVVLDKIKEYESVSKEKTKLDLQIEEIEEQIRQACPELYSKLDELNTKSKSKADRLKEISSETTPFFAKAVEIDEGDKTLIYGKVQATYVYPTTKHQFDLKSFIEEQNEFYTDNISMFDPYSTFTEVSGYTKFTVKKK